MAGFSLILVAGLQPRQQQRAFIWRAAALHHWKELLQVRHIPGKKREILSSSLTQIFNSKHLTRDRMVVGEGIGTSVELTKRARTQMQINDNSCSTPVALSPLDKVWYPTEALAGSRAGLVE